MNGAAALANDGEVEGLKMSHDWIASLETSNGHRRVCSRQNLAAMLRDDILGGRLTTESTVAVHAKQPDGTWRKVTLPLRGLLRSDFELRVLYEPVWAHAIAGLKWGAMLGIGLKLAETFVRLLAVDGTMAFFFLLVIGFCAIPRVGTTIMIGAAFLMSKLTKVNMFFVVVGALIAGALLGCLPGMAVGGVVGLSRRRHLHVAPDAKFEGLEVGLKAVVLPLLGAAGVWALYVLVVIPWLGGAR